MKIQELLKTEEDLEHKYQCAVVEWAHANEKRYPALELLHAIPNGGGRGKPFITRSGKKLPPLLAVRLKREGLLSGIPDLHLPVARGEYHSLYIEMKAGDGILSENQKRLFPLLRSEGNKVEVCWTPEDGIKALREYLKS